MVQIDVNRWGLQQVAKKVGSLYSLPDIYYRVGQLLLRDTLDLEAVREILQYDPALVIRLLRLARCKDVGAEPSLDSVSRALSRIEGGQVHDLLLAAVSVETFHRISSNLLDMEDFWHHSVYCGLIAKDLANRCHVLHTERMFTAGLLHDVGLLVLYQEYPEYAAEIRREVGSSKHALIDAERQGLGFSHGELGAALFRTWKLPAIYSEVSRFHHDPAQSRQFPLETALVHLADIGASWVEPGHKLKKGHPTPDPWVWSFTGLKERALKEALEQASLQFFEVLETIAPGGLEIH